jgi:hypothetical protein
LKFDVITLIGVLEYANLYIDSPEPHERLLKKCFEMLNPDGQLIIAIENKMGLKYFLGAPEDHFGIPMYGIENRYTANSVRTFGKHELKELLSNTGFISADFHVPLPDYKLTTSVVLSAGLDNKMFDAASLIRHSINSDQQLPSSLAFVPEMALKTVHENNLGIEFANSFLVVANKSNAIFTDREILAYHYSTNRRRDFCKSAKFQIRNNSIEVETISLGLPDFTGPLIQKIAEPIEYLPGVLLSDQLYELISLESWSHDDLGKFYTGYLKILQSKQISGQIDSDICFLPGGFIDLIPQNILITAGGKVHIFDQEWESREPIDIRQIIFRSILTVSKLSILGKDEKGVNHSLSTITDLVFSLLDIEISDDDVLSFLSKEHSYQVQISGLQESFTNYAKSFEVRLGRNRFNSDAFSGLIAEHNRVLADLIQQRDAALADRDVAVGDLIQQRDEALADRDVAVADLIQQRDEALADRDVAVGDLIQQRDEALADRDVAVGDLIQQRDEALADRDVAVADLIQQRDDLATKLEKIRSTFIYRYLLRRFFHE